LDLQILFFLVGHRVWLLEYGNSVLDLTLLCELESITLKTNQDLNDSLLIREDKWTLLSFIRNRFRARILTNLVKLVAEINCFRVSLLLLNGDNLLHGIHNVEPGDDLPKFIGFDLSIIQQVLNGEVHQITRVVLGFQILL